MIDKRIKKVMGDVFGIDPARIDVKASPDSIGEWDSLRHMNLVVALEEEFEVRFPDEAIAEMISFKLIEYHLKKLLK